MASHTPLQRPPEQAIGPWLHHLSQLMPPTGVLLVGAGAGSGPWVQLLQTLAVPSATLVEADDTQFEQLQRTVPQQPGWRLRKQVVGPHTETVAYHQASNPAESGLLAPESLRSLWPNLKTTHKQNRQAIALAELQQDAETPANWLLIDCLPALPILQGAAQQLAGIDVIALRVLLTSHSLPTATNADADTHTETGTASAVTPHAATADQLQPALLALGFRCLALETSRHPSVGHALFVRDTAALAQQQQQQLAQQTQTHAQALAQAKAQVQAATEALAQATASATAAAQQAEERAAQVQQLTQAKAAAEKLAAERQQRIDALQAEHKQATEQAQAAAKAAEQAKAAAAEATAAAAKQAEERAAQVQQLTQAKAAAEKLAVERQQRIDALQAEHKQATEQAQAATQAAEQAKAAAAETTATATAAAATAAKQAEERAAQVQQLTQAKAVAEKLAAERQQRIDALQAEHKQAPEQAQAAAKAAEQAKAVAAETTATASVAAAAAADKQAEECAAQVQQLTQAKAAAEKLAAERQQRIDALQAEHKQATEQAQAATQAAEQAKAAAAETTATATETAAAKQAEERAAQVQQLTQAKAAAEKLATERQQQIDQHKQALAHAKAEADKLAAHHQEELRKLTEQLKLDSSTSQQTAQHLAALTQQQDQLAPALSATNQLPKQWQTFAEAVTTRLATTETALAQMSHLLAPEILPGLLLPKLSEKLLEQSNSQKDQLKEVETRLRTEFGKGLGNAVKQLEAFVSIQNYLNTGESISDFHGWPISPDIALFLIEKMRERQYDLIIEFGSGTSTLLFAKVLANQIKNQQQSRAPGPPFHSTKIISFEHNTVYRDKTQKLLDTQQLAEHVQLIHAPLVDWTDGENQYLYYDCEATIKQLATDSKQFKKRILILIDGPPGVTCANARYPAAAIVFNHLGTHDIDLVLDDANRPEEERVIAMWKSLWKKRSIHIFEKNIPSEKGIYLAVNYS